MGNCCVKRQCQEPNKPVSAVHITLNGVAEARKSHPLNKSSKKLNSTSKAFPNGLDVPRTSNFSPNTRKAKRSKHDRRKALVRPKNSNVPSNTQIGGSGIKRREGKRRGKLPAAKERTTRKTKSQLHCFCYSVLKKATNNFSKKNLIGEGGFGDVYKGYLTYSTMEAAKQNEGFAVAVKRLIPQRPQGCESWQTEVDILSHLNHPNIVRLIGCCKEGAHRLVVYEYMAKGSLDCCLFRDYQKELNWRKRIDIAIGAAKGLAYLHTNGKKSIIHRDVKASNVLLDSNFNAKISDFGLAKYGPDDERDHVSTRVLGTKGYFAPEYFKSGHLTVRADVYSFGVVLLEIFSGCGVDKRCSKGFAGDLVQRAKPILSRNTEPELRRIIDARFKWKVPMEEARKFAELTNLCLSLDPEERPTMEEVVAGLEKIQGNVNCAGNHEQNNSRAARFRVTANPPERNSKASKS